MSAAAEKIPETVEAEDVLFSQQRGNRTILLNRPKKLNSLNLSMIEKILPRLKVRHLSVTPVELIRDLGEIRFGEGDDIERCW